MRKGRDRKHRLRLRDRLRRWLGVVDFDNLVERFRRMESMTKSIYESTQVGLDIHTKKGSWAVVCINGKPDYVSFFNLKAADAHQVKAFLNHFRARDDRNIVIDSPYGTKGLFLD
jgi:hypothetical protein